MVMFWRMFAIVSRDRCDHARDVDHAAVQDRGVGGFERDVGAAAHRDADICRGERRGVVDAVADLGDRPSLRLQFADDALLVLRQEFGPWLDVERRADRLRGAMIVAGHHDHA